MDSKARSYRDGSFGSQLIPKRKKDVYVIENKVVSMYARGMSQRVLGGLKK